MLNHPAVAAAYEDWRASVESIEPSRALPDPQFVFEADVTNTLLQFMPGLMFNLTTAGKRAAMAREATASSQVAYRAYVSAVMDAASRVRATWIELAYLGEAIRLEEETLGALDQSAAVAEADYSTGRGMATLEGRVRLASEKARAQSNAGAVNRKARLRALALQGVPRASSLGPGPAWPNPALVATALPPEDELWRRIQAFNPGLAQMRAMVDMSVAGVEVARSAGTPDFSLGAMADLRANPLLVRPLASLSLPIWRSKIASMTSAAEARRDAAAARVGAEELNMAARLAQMLYMVRESDRMIAYVDSTALPDYERTIASVEAGYQSGMNSLAMVPGTRLMSIAMRLERAAALRERESAVNDVLLMEAEAAPSGSPILAEGTHPKSLVF